MTKVKKALLSNIVPIVFLVICVLGVIVSQTSVVTIIGDVVNRFDRNILLVLSLIIPVTCGLGMNFAIVIGAMCGQIGLITVKLMNLSGMPAVLTAAAFGALCAIVAGTLCGMILNKTKGQEMITGMIVGYFSNGIYQFIMLFVIGGIIKVSSDIILTGGIGIKNTIDLGSMQYALDNIKIFGMNTRVDCFTGLIVFGIFFIAMMLIRALKQKKFDKTFTGVVCACAAAIGFGIYGQNAKTMQWNMARMMIRIPVFTFMLFVLVCWLINKFSKTKLGQDMRSIGHDREVAASSGIDVDRTRIIAIIISTVLAAWGQIIFYQNLGTMDAYYGHEKVGTFCVAAILIGGASVKKATVGQAILGTVLFHALYNISPLAAQKLVGDSVIGNYFRMALCYGIIAFSLIAHVLESRRKNK